MAKAKRLPSGSWRIRVYSHTDPEGKKHYESFTASTKHEAEMIASKFQNDLERRRSDDLTVKEAVTLYIETNAAVLSPSTIEGYTKDARQFKSIEHLRIRKLSSADLQGFISELANRGLANKTIKNRYDLLKSALKFCGIDRTFVVHMPVTPKFNKVSPENDQVIALLNNASPKMKLCICLAAFHSLRRGEIAALKYGDLQGNELTIHADMVHSVDGWIYKETPKTTTSNRTVYLTQTELELIGSGDPDEYIVNIVPSSIGTNFYNLCKKTGVKMRFHDLRGYFASIAAGIMPDFYTSSLGGWKEGSRVLKEHYQKPIVSIKEGYAQKLNEYFENMIIQNNA